MSARVRLVELDVVDSTQDEVRARLAGAAAGQVVAVRARSQRDGRGRRGRQWQDPAGDALLLSVGVRDAALPSRVERLPADVASALLDCCAPRGALAWKAPNDLVSAADGAKVAGILVDLRTTGERVDELVVGVGCNLTGAAFTTRDGRAADTLSSLGVRLDVGALVQRIGALLVSEPR